MALEYCGRCGCPNDHVGKPCSREIPFVERDDEGNVTNREMRVCPCPFGVRSDVYLNQQISVMIGALRNVQLALRDLFTQNLLAHNLEVTEQGELRKKVDLSLH